jgi:hypothetical protein
VVKESCDAGIELGEAAEPLATANGLAIRRYEETGTLIGGVASHPASIRRWDVVGKKQAGPGVPRPAGQMGMKFTPERGHNQKRNFTVS